MPVELLISEYYGQQNQLLFTSGDDANLNL